MRRYWKEGKNEKILKEREGKRRCGKEEKDEKILKGRK